MLTLALLIPGVSMPAFALEPHLQASLITCRPGPEVYELFGHEALRIRGFDEKGLPVDTVWNYGVFDFAAPGFLYRFVKGDTDYILYPCPTPWFVESYVQRGSGVVEQDLDLTPEETARLRKLLQINALPENRRYRYNYVRDNCSTRVADMVDSAVIGRKIVYPENLSYSSFRDAMRDMHVNYPWYQFGIDLVLGSGIDTPLKSRQELFSPMLLERRASEARFSDGRPLVASSRVIYTGDPSGNEYDDGTFGSQYGPTPWWVSPMAIAFLLLLSSIIIGIWQWKKSRLARIAYTLFFGLLGIAGCVVWFLAFLSSHDSTSPNLLTLWLNPLQLVIAVCIWWRRLRPVALAMSIVDVVVLVLLVAAWPMQKQTANPAVFPLWGATLALCLSFAVVYPAMRRSPAIGKGKSIGVRKTRSGRVRSDAVPNIGKASKTRRKR